MPVGKGKTSFIDTRDIGEAAAICLTESGHVNKTYDLTGSEALTYEDIANIMSKVLKREIKYKNPNVFIFRKVSLKRGMPKEFVNVMSILYTMTKFGTATLVTNDLEDILKRPPITFEQYAIDYKQDFELS